jgi:hypothetical protein
MSFIKGNPSKALASFYLCGYLGMIYPGHPFHGGKQTIDVLGHVKVAFTPIEICHFLNFPPSYIFQEIL